jgi:hypothetical protein
MINGEAATAAVVVAAETAPASRPLLLLGMEGRQGPDWRAGAAAGRCCVQHERSATCSQLLPRLPR